MQVTVVSELNVMRKRGAPVTPSPSQPLRERKLCSIHSNTTSGTVACSFHPNTTSGTVARWAPRGMPFAIKGSLALRTEAEGGAGWVVEWSGRQAVVFGEKTGDRDKEPAMR